MHHHLIAVFRALLPTNTTKYLWNISIQDNYFKTTKNVREMLQPNGSVFQLTININYASFNSTTPSL